MHRWFRCFLLAAVLATAALPLSAAAPLVVGIIGDYGSGDTNEANVAKLVKSWNPDFIITVGDNNYPDGASASLDANVGQFYHEFINPYPGQYGPGAETNRFFPTLGNHDYDVPAVGRPYMGYFTGLPGNGRYYNFRRGPVEFFALNSDAAEPHGNTPVSFQATWLHKKMQESTAPWKLVYFHEAPYSSGYWHGSYTGEALHMHWPFKEWGASIVLAGHDHIYERVRAGGLTYLVNGMGGGRIDPTARRVPGSQLTYTNMQGALRLDATETNLLFQFINWQGKVIDRVALPEGK
jgi:tartrate-resistant acid phosphatase type 5